MLSLRLLGDLEIERDGRRASLPPSRKTRALLGYLAASGRPHRRDRLCSLLWDIPDDPRGALRWSLSKLRPLVDEAGVVRIVADRETVAFDAAGAGVDLLAVRQACAGDVGDLPTDRLLALAEGFRGEFLEGLDLPNHHDFQAWLVAEREEARKLHAAILRALVDRFRATPPDALRYARTLVRIEPYDSEARADLVRLLGAAARRGEAEEQYRVGSRVLEEAGAPVEPLRQAWLQVRGAKRPCEPPAPASGVAPTSGARATDIEAREQQIRFCTSPDGVRIAYATVGKGPPLLKTANWMNHLEFDWQSPVWRHWMRELSRDHTLVRYDERGNGLSDWEVDDISFPAFVRDLETVIDASGHERFVLLGVSQGCAIAVDYVVRHPERVSHLILYGGYTRGWRARANRVEIERREALKTLIRQGWGQDNPAFRQVFTTLFIPDATAEQMQWFNELQRVSCSPENAIRLQEAFSTIDVRHLLPKVTVPTLVVHCRGDAVIPFSEGREYAAGIAGARFVALESRNHLLVEHEPAWPRFLSELRTFLASVGERAPRSARRGRDVTG